MKFALLQLLFLQPVTYKNIIDPKDLLQHTLSGNLKKYVFMRS